MSSDTQEKVEVGDDELLKGEFSSASFDCEKCVSSCLLWLRCRCALAFRVVTKASFLSHGFRWTNDRFKNTTFQLMKEKQRELHRLVESPKRV